MFGKYGKHKEQTGIPWRERFVHIDSDNVNDSNNYYLSVNENVAEVDSSDIGANCIVYLPDPGECPGYMFDVFSPDVGTATNKVEVMDPQGNQFGNDLDADGDYITLISTGFKYRTLANSAA